MTSTIKRIGLFLYDGGWREFWSIAGPPIVVSLLYGGAMAVVYLWRN